MKKLIHPLFYLSILFTTSCASTYKPIRPESVRYDYSELSAEGGISTSYAYDMLTLRNNSKYARKEVKNSIKVVSVKVVNNTNAPLLVGRDCRLFLGSREVVPMETSVATKKLNQGVPIYLLYSLLFLNITQSTTTSGSGYQPNSSTTSIPIGVPISGGNMLVAANANKNLRHELVEKNIMNKTIGPGETAYGLVCLNETVSGRLRFEFTPAK